LNTDKIFFAKKFNLGTKNTPVGWRFGWVVFARTDLLFLARRSVRNAVPKKVGDRGRWKRTVTGHASGSVARRSAAKTSARLRTMTLVLTENCVRVIQRPIVLVVLYWRCVNNDSGHTRVGVLDS
jgi:hypothetical protein